MNRNQNRKQSFTIPLSDVPNGYQITIYTIPDAEIRLQATRLGIGEGSCVKCLGRIALGPVVVARGNQEIAIGFRLARQIRVKPERA